MKIGVYGGSGYLGSSLIKVLEENGIEVVALARGQYPMDSRFTCILDASFPCNYKNKKIFKKYMDTLDIRLNKASTLKYIYLGSYSSVGVVRSIYGENKSKAEKLVQNKGGTVLRVGLVVDKNNPGGRFGELKEIMDQLPVNFKIPESWCPIKITRLSDLNQAVSTLVSKQTLMKSEIEVEQTLQTNLNFLLVGAKSRKLTIFFPDFALRIFFLLVSVIPLGLLDNLNSIGYRVAGNNSSDS